MCYHNVAIDAFNTGFLCVALKRLATNPFCLFYSCRRAVEGARQSSPKVWSGALQPESRGAAVAMHHNQDHLLKGGRAPAACRVGRHPPTSIWQTAALVESQSGLPVQEGTENIVTNLFSLILSCFLFCRPFYLYMFGVSPVHLNTWLFMWSHLCARKYFIGPNTHLYFTLYLNSRVPVRTFSPVQAANRGVSCLECWEKTLY